MLTRSRFGFATNENAAIANKDTMAKQKGNNAPVVTRSRTALGDLKNRNIEPIKPAKKQQASVKKAAKPVDHRAENAAKQLKNYRSHRLLFRKNSLTSPIVFEYVDSETQECSDVATVFPFIELIFNYMQNRELAKLPVTQDFMKRGWEINSRMRYVLINWLVQIHHNYKLQPETLFLCVAILDRFIMLHGSSVNRERFQLVGITSLFIAAKFEEMFPPDISDFTAVTNESFTKIDIRNCEQEILQSIDFYLSIPIPLVFLRRLSKAINADRMMHNLAKYFLELSVQEYELAHFSGNLKATASLCLSRALCMQTTDLSKTCCKLVTYLSGLSLDDLREPIRLLARAAYRQNSPSKYRAIYDKYRLDDFYGRVAALPQLRSTLMERLADLKFDSNGDVCLP